MINIFLEKLLLFSPLTPEASSSHGHACDVDVYLWPQPRSLKLCESVYIHVMLQSVQPWSNTGLQIINVSILLFSVVLQLSNI